MRDSLAIKKLLYESSSPLVLCAEKANQEVQEGKDQETAQSEKRFPLQNPRWEKTKLTIRYLHHENISLAE